jgi:type II secretory pathway pseudopilin PulG
MTPVRPIGFPPRRAQGAFTLIEVLLVTMIIVLAISIVVPSFGNAMKGARLRTATRDIVSLSRYARNASILRQQQHVMLFHREEGKVELLTLQRSGFQGAAQDPFQSLESAREAQRNAEEADATEAVTVATSGLKSRRLGSGVGFSEITSVAEDQEENGVHWVNYYPNGMCDAHTVTIADARGKQMVVKVDGITGEIHVEQNW